MAGKMKLGINSQCYDRAIASGRIDLFDLLKMGKELRLDGMEIEDKHFASTEPAYLEELKAKDLICFNDLSGLKVQLNFFGFRIVRFKQVARRKQEYACGDKDGEEYICVH